MNPACAYLKRIMNDPAADPSRRDRMAICLASIEVRAAEAVGKKAAAEDRAETSHISTPWEELLNRDPDPPKRPTPMPDQSATWDELLPKVPMVPDEEGDETDDNRWGKFVESQRRLLNGED